MAVVIVTGLLFLILLGLCGGKLSNLDKRQIRRTLTVTIVSFYLGTVLCAIAGLFEPSEEFFKILDGLNLAFIATISFYFGSRTIESYIDSKYPKSAEEHPRKESAEQK